MKKLSILAMALLAFVACTKEDPTISINPTTANLKTEGGTVNVNVTSNSAWTATCDYSSDIIISPASGTGDSPVSITVPANTSGSTNSIKVRFICTEGGCNVELIITQEFSEPKAELKVSGYDENWDFEGGTDTLTVVSNYPWTTITDGVTVNPTSGNAGTTQVFVTVPKNETKEEKKSLLTISNKGIVTENTELLYYTVMSPYLNYGGEYYALAKMKDGNIWMAENLRYVPEGYTPSSSLTDVKAGIYNPVKLNAGHTAIEFTDEAAVVKSNGYFYQSEVALGLKVGDITTEAQAKALEGTQGICPKGWHIPTATEIINLVGKAVTPYETKTSAPYYDAEKGNATIDKLNKDGFNAAAWGAVTIQDNTKTAATLMGHLKNYPDIISSGYICGSTYTSKTEKSGSITNFQFLGFMPMANNGTFNGAKLSYRVGANVRCVKDVKK